MRWFIALLMLASCARGAIVVSFVDRGVPTDGMRTMNGFRGTLIRLHSDEGPILRVRAMSLGLYGAFVHRWTDPMESSDYTVRSPGPPPADNTTPSELNFDSHYLGDFSHFTNATFEENFGEFGQSFRTGIPSTPGVGYFSATPSPTDQPIALVQAGYLAATYDVLPPFQSSSMDLAYVVSDSPITVSVSVLTPAGDRFIFERSVPEPSAMWLGLMSVFSLIRRSPRCMIEPLERRSLRSVS